MTAGSWATGNSAAVTIKNTFVHLRDDPEDEEETPHSQRRCLSLPPSIRLAGIVARKTSVHSEVSTCAGTSCDATVAGGKVSECASPASTAANTPPASPRQRRPNWPDVEEECPLPPDPPSQSTPPACTPARTRLNAKAARWRPAGDGAEQQLVHRQVALAMQRLQATLDRGGARARVEVRAEETGQCCLVLCIRPEDSWMTEGLLTAAKDAVLSVGESDRVFVLGHQGRPFTPQTHGFSAVLAAVEETEQACWELCKKGFCRRGTACRWQHPAAYPVNVVVARQTESQATQRISDLRGITATGLRGGD